MKFLWMINNAFLGSFVCYFLIKLIPLLTFAIFSLICLLKSSFSARWLDVISVRLDVLTTVVEEYWSMNRFMSFSGGITSWAYLEMSGLKDIAQW